MVLALPLGEPVPTKLFASFDGASVTMHGHTALAYEAVLAALAGSFQNVRPPRSTAIASTVAWRTHGRRESFEIG